MHTILFKPETYKLPTFITLLTQKVIQPQKLLKAQLKGTPDAKHNIKKLVKTTIKKANEPKGQEALDILQYLTATYPVAFHIAGEMRKAEAEGADIIAINTTLLSANDIEFIAQLADSLSLLEYSDGFVTAAFPVAEGIETLTTDDFVELIEFYSELV